MVQGVHPCKTFTRAGNLHELEAAASSPCRVVRARRVRVTCCLPRPAVARRRLVSESVPRTCRSAGVRWPV